MKKNKSVLINDEMDIRNLVQDLWQHKILILSVSILSMLLAYIIIPNDNNSHYTKSSIIIKKFSNETFKPYQNIYQYNDLLKSNIHINFEEEFNKKFFNNFLSLYNIVAFLEESKDFDDLKIFFKLKKINPVNYFYNKNYGTNLNNVDASSFYFFFILPEKTDDNKFFKNYSNFILDITKIYIKNLINSELDRIIFQNEEILGAVEKFNSTDLSKLTLRDKNLIDYYTTSLISSQKNQLGKTSSLKELKFLLDNHISNIDLRFYIFSEKLSDRPNSSNINLLLGLILGFFLSLVIIVLKKSFFNYI